MTSVKTLSLKPLARAIALASVAMISPLASATGLLDDNSTPWTPRANLYGLFGQQQGAGYMDALIPLKGRGDFLWYLNGVYGQGVNERSLASIGSGVRKLMHSSHGDVILYPN